MEITNRKPPGKKLIKNMPIHTKWILLTVAGLLLISYGLFVFNEALFLRHSGAEANKWGLLIAYSLIVFNAGLLIFAKGITFRVRMETRRIVRKMLKERQKKIQNSTVATNKPLSPTKMLETK